MRHIGLSICLCLALSACVYGNTMAVWNFNDATSGDLGFVVDRGNGIMSSDFTASNISYYAGTTINSQDNDPAGLALRLSGSANNGKNLTWIMNTSGFDSIDVSFATIRSNTGFGNNQLFYSIDSGNNWVNFGSFSSSVSFGLQEFDLSGIPNLNDNPNAGFRIVFGGATSSSGNIRIDNLAVSGSPIVPPILNPVPEPSSGLFVAAGSICLLLGRVIRKRSC
jgi:hypothetical protein